MAVELVLIIASLLVPVLAILAVNEIAIHRAAIKNLDEKSRYVLYDMDEVVVLIALLPDVFLSFKTSTHQGTIQQFAQQLHDNTFANELMVALVKDRAAPPPPQGLTLKKAKLRISHAECSPMVWGSAVRYNGVSVLNGRVTLVLVPSIFRKLGG